MSFMLPLEINGAPQVESLKVEQLIVRVIKGVFTVYRPSHKMYIKN